MSSISDEVQQLNAISSTITLVLLCVAFALGATGLLLNVIVFTRPTLRREPASLYFLSSTYFNLFIVFTLIPTRILSNSYNIDMGYYNLGICKVEYFAFYSIRTISCWLITLACVDRYLHSSPNANIRRISTLKTARIAIGMIIILISISYSHMIVYMNIVYKASQLGDSSPSCIGQNSIYRSFLAIWYMTLYSLCPSFLMLFFGCLTLKNIRQRRRTIVNVNENNRIARRTDTQLLRMLAVQVFAIVITTLPQSVSQLYVSLTAYKAKDTLQLAQENLISKTVGGMTFFAHSSSFYLFTLSGTMFRKELYKFLRKYCFSNRNRIHATHVETS